ncbi:MAG: metal ABC transporter permease [Clostridia bacterium]|nr:metal ABC transporter permease [Clostridia bacterium]
MLDTLILVFSQGFMQRAVLGGIVISLCASLLGVSLVLKRYSMIGDGLSHVGFGAVVVATALGFAPLAVAIPVVVIAAFLLLRLGESSEIKGDAAVALVSTGSLAVGVTASSLSGGMNQDFNSYMFGTILGLSESDVVLSIAVSIPVLILFILFYNKIFAVTFDENFSKATGVKVELYNALVAVLTAIIIVLGMRLMGALLISSLVIFPSLTSMRVCRTFKGVVICSALVSVMCFLVGICLSVLYDLPTGASIVLANIVVFFIFWICGKIKNR